MAELRRAARHVAQYRVGYLAAGFLLIAAATCGVRTGVGLDAGAMRLSLSAWGIVRMLAAEAAGVGLLALASAHPFGLALCAALLCGKGFSVGLMWGWWTAQLGLGGALIFTVAMLPQGLASLGAWAYGGCVAGYAALRVLRPARRELMKMLVCVFLLQAIAALLRCLGCALAGL